MKTNILVLSSLLSLGAAAAAFAGDGFERVDASQLPPRVRRSFDAVTRGERIHDVRVQSIRGRMIYEIDTGRDGGRILRIAADGEVLHSAYEPPRDTRRRDDIYAAPPPPPPPRGVVVVGPPPVVVAPAPVIVRYDDLPYRVRQRIDRDHRDHHVSRVTRETVEGRVVFGIQFGDNAAAVYFGEDGSSFRRR